MRKFMSRSEGFTLIELMIVILIIAILVAIAVPVYLNARKNAQRRTCQSNIRTVDGSVQAYEAMFDEPTYPTSIDQLTEPGTKVLKSIPQCQSTTQPYVLKTGVTPPTISCPSDQSNHTI